LEVLHIAQLCFFKILLCSVRMFWQVRGVDTEYIEWRQSPAPAAAAAAATRDCS